MNTQERLAQIRAQAREMFPALEDAVKVGTDTYIVQVADGYAKIVLSAIKDVEFDVEEARADYEFELDEKARKAEAKAEAKAAKENAKKNKG